MAWTRGAVQRPPPGIALHGRKLRLWVAAAGAPGGSRACLLGLGNEEEAWPAVGRALLNVGLRAELLGPRAGGPAYRIVGRRRLGRLAEMAGDPPPQAPAGHWPV